MDNRHPIIWIVGATRSSKSYLAKGLSCDGSAKLDFHMISTSDLFRQEYQKPDTYSRKFVFNLSAFASKKLSDNPDYNIKHVSNILENTDKPCIIEGERNPIEFAKLYDPQKDMVFFLKRKNIQKYDTTIEKGIDVIEQQVRWCVNNGLAPQSSVLKIIFGNNVVSVKDFGKNNQPDEVVFEADVGFSTNQTPYPWINPMIGLAQEKILQYYANIASTPNVDPQPQNVFSALGQG